ncbi:5089_t:CDS:2 [Acaulospora morrowiae]|uniref:5089_t:CDS:1 n=1 Tax=Acaulospora morrowiae TaxID=94023 RepID=A0A9N8ZF14_9GLOM|nr:5089_t:CDS:2 [Acaulospora morrowiae]
MSTSLIRNKILVLGRRNVGKLSIIKQILSSSNQRIDEIILDQNNENGETSDNANHAGMKIPWKIITKYYTANVEFWVDETVHKSQLDSEVIDGYENEENGIGKVVDAILFIFKKNEPSTFDDIQAYLPFIQKYEPSITLAVGTGRNIQHDTIDAENDPFEDWCIENGFEYVDLDMKKRDDEIAERVGIERILEALQSHMWEDMTRLSKTNKTSDHIEDTNNKELSEAISQLNHKENNSHLESAPEFDDHNSAPFDDNDTEFFGDALPSQQEIESMHQHIFGDFDDEDGFDKVLARLNSLRERGKTLSDDERRKLAARVACSFNLHMNNE